MSPSTDTHSVPTTSTETTTPAPLKSYYVTQTYFPTTIKDLIFNFYDNYKDVLATFDNKFKEYL